MRLTFSSSSAMVSTALPKFSPLSNSSSPSIALSMPLVILCLAMKVPSCTVRASACLHTEQYSMRCCEYSRSSRPCYQTRKPSRSIDWERTYSISVHSSDGRRHEVDPYEDRQR